MQNKKIVRIFAAWFLLLRSVERQRAKPRITAFRRLTHIKFDYISASRQGSEPKKQRYDAAGSNGAKTLCRL